MLPQINAEECEEEEEMEDEEEIDAQTHPVILISFFFF